MDAVITYVNGLDPLWQKDYADAMNVPVMAKRFRDWGTLKYLLRGIEVNMPFVKNVYLVVARESQVPSWADRNVLKVVLHEDIIPQEYLPTFNSTTIEMFLHRIPGLDERYLYFNDDMFPVAPSLETDFYAGDKIAMGFSTCFFSRAMYKRQTMNSDHLALRALDRKPGLFFTRPQHTCSPMLKSACEELYEKVENEIAGTLSRTRTMANLNQYLYLNYMLHSGRAVRRRIKGKFFSLAVVSASRIADYIRKPGKNLVCVNDVHLSDEKFEVCRRELLSGFNDRLPDKSRFEL